MTDDPIGKATPTAEEERRRNRGERITEHEYDGSPLQPGAHPPGDPVRKEADEGAVAQAEPKLAHADPKLQVEAKADVKAEEAKPDEEKASAAEPHRASYRTRRAKAEGDE